MRLYIIRHGDPDYERNALTDRGRLEAAALGERLAGEGLTHLYTSPSGRARQTMQYTAETTGLTPTVLPWADELGGLHWELPDGQTAWAWHVEGEVVRRNPSLASRQGWHEQPPLDHPGFREIVEALQRASDAFLVEHGYVREGDVYRMARANRDRIAVFCHGGMGVAWIAHLLALPVSLAWCGLFMATSSVTTVLFEERSKEVASPRCLAISDTSHLYHARLAVGTCGAPANFD